MPNYVYRSQNIQPNTHIYVLKPKIFKYFYWSKICKLYIEDKLFKYIYWSQNGKDQGQGSEESQIELLQPIKSLWRIITASQMGPHGNHQRVIIIQNNQAIINTTWKIWPPNKLFFGSELESKSLSFPRLSDAKENRVVLFRNQKCCSLQISMLHKNWVNILKKI